MIGDVAVGVARHINDLGKFVANHRGLAMDHNPINRELAADFGRACDGAARGCLDCFIAARMIGVPMRVPDLGDPPAFEIGLPQIFGGIGRIDRNGFVAVGIVQQKAVIVRQAGELMNCEHPGRLEPHSP